MALPSRRSRPGGIAGALRPPPLGRFRGLCVCPPLRLCGTFLPLCPSCSRLSFAVRRFVRFHRDFKVGFPLSIKAVTGIALNLKIASGVESPF